MSWRETRHALSAAADAKYLSRHYGFFRPFTSATRSAFLPRPDHATADDAMMRGAMHVQCRIMRDIKRRPASSPMRGDKCALECRRRDIGSPRRIPRTSRRRNFTAAVTAILRRSRARRFRRAAARRFALDFDAQARALLMMLTCAVRARGGMRCGQGDADVLRALLTWLRHGRQFFISRP